MERIKYLMDKCKGPVFININERRGHGENIYTAIENINVLQKFCEGEPLSDEIKEGMIRTNSIVDVMCFPRTQVSSYLIYHYDLESALDEMVKIIKGLKEVK